MMNNKQIGTEFEHEVVEILKGAGAWVHFLTPDSRGAQPFDIISVKDGVATAIDCKTSVKHVFPITRLEQNQITAFERWMACGNMPPLIFIKYNGKIKMISYVELKKKGRVDLDAI